MRLVRPAALGVSALVTAVLIVGLPVATPPVARGARHASLAVGGAERLAATLDPGWSFSMVGVSWSGSREAAGRAQLRTSADGRRWSSWRELEPNDASPDRGSREDRGIVATEPVWVRSARFAQVRWDGGRPPRGLRLHAIDPGPDRFLPPSSAAAAPNAPDVVTRAQWGADESVRRCCATYAPELEFAVVHHTVTSNGYAPSESAGIVRGIYEYHVRVNGWDDIGYNFLVDAYGKVYEGRHGGIAEPVVGAHSEGFNTGSTGIALIGSHQSRAPSSSAMHALRGTLAWKLDLHHVDPRGTATVVSGGSRKHPAGRSVRVNAVSGHRDLQETACPGDTVASQLPRLQADAYATGLPKIVNPTAAPEIFSPNGDGRGDVLQITAGVSDGATWQVRVRDGGTVLRSWSGAGTLDVRWDGSTQTGGAVGHGYYDVEISASAGGASATPAELTAGLYRDPWGAWTRAGSPVEAIRVPRVTQGTGGSYHLVGRGASGAMYHWRSTSDGWDAGRRLGRDGDRANTSGRFGLATAGGEQHVVIRGRASHLYHGRIRADGSFAGWSRIGRSSDRGSDIAVTAADDGSVHALTVGMNGNLYASRYKGSWSSWRRVGSSSDRGTQPVLATGLAGDVLAVVVGGSSVLYANKLDPGRGWRPRWSLAGGGRGRGQNPTIAVVPEGFIVIVRGQTTPNLWHATGTIGRWSGWRRIGSASDSGFEPAALTALEDVVLVVRGRTTSRLYANVRAPDGSWTGWDEAGDSLQNGAFPSLATSGETVVLAAEAAGGGPATIVARPPLRSR